MENQASHQNPAECPLLWKNRLVELNQHPALLEDGEEQAQLCQPVTPSPAQAAGNTAAPAASQSSPLKRPSGTPPPQKEKRLAALWLSSQPCAPEPFHASTAPDSSRWGRGWAHLVDVDGLQRQLPQPLPAVPVALGGRGYAPAARLTSRAMLKIHDGGFCGSATYGERESLGNEGKHQGGQ